MSYPKTVPVLVEENFCIGRGYDSNKPDCMCMQARLAKVFFNDNPNSRPYYRAYDMVLKEMNRHLEKGQVLQEPMTHRLNSDGTFRTVIGGNDSGCFSRETLADIWNKVMRKLGYTEITNG
jgi:pantothenate kinase